MGSKVTRAELVEAVRRIIDADGSKEELVAHILDRQNQEAGRLPPLETVLPDDPRIRDLRLKPHDLAAYDRLSALEEDDS